MGALEAITKGLSGAAEGFVQGASQGVRSAENQIKAQELSQKLQVANSMGGMNNTAAQKIYADIIREMKSTGLTPRDVINARTIPTPVEQAQIARYQTMGESSGLRAATALMGSLARDERQYDKPDSPGYQSWQQEMGMARDLVFSQLRPTGSASPMTLQPTPTPQPATPNAAPPRPLGRMVNLNAAAPAAVGPRTATPALANVPAIQPPTAPTARLKRLTPQQAAQPRALWAQGLAQTSQSPKQVVDNALWGAPPELRRLIQQARQAGVPDERIAASDEVQAYFAQGM